MSGGRRRPGCCRIILAPLLACAAFCLLLGGLPLRPRATDKDVFLSDACTDEDGKRILRRLCWDFAEGSAAGDLCPDLCVRGLMVYQRCLYYERGKKVMAVRWRGRPVVLKSQLENLSSYRPLGWLEYQDAGAEDASPLAILHAATLEVRRWLGLAGEGEDDVEEGAHGSPASLPARKIYSRAELTSMWSLLQQEEYAFLRVLQDLSAHVPKVLGSCGHFYAVESLSAGHAWDRNIFSLENGEQRATDVHRLALSFLDMVRHFDDDFAHKVHLCDVKPENFAIRKDLTVVAIDVDMAFFQPKMEEILGHQCAGDDDCRFFDCTSSCDLAARHCRRQRANTNLQVAVRPLSPRRRDWKEELSALSASGDLPENLQTLVFSHAARRQSGAPAAGGAAEGGAGMRRARPSGGRPGRAPPPPPCADPPSPGRQMITPSVNTNLIK
ncbi:divergent protein kinase domain 1C-like isoform X2 [Stigmatopora nigra]